MALVVPTILTAANCVIFARFFKFPSPKVFGLFLVCAMITLLILALLIHRQRNIKISQMSFDFARKEAQYMELKQQIDPHFLFNNLNVMISFIETNPARAISFGQHLSTVYRHFLSSHREEFVPVEEELHFLREYLEIYKAKFDNGFVTEFGSLNTSGLYVLSMAVREVADNFFKHNPADPGNPPVLKVSLGGEFLVFENTRTGSGSGTPGTGLANIVKRYKILTGLDVGIVDGETFAVKLPLLRL